MWIRVKSFLVIAAAALVCLYAGCSENSKKGDAGTVRSIVTSDTILSGMIASLLPSHRYAIKSMLPPAQCPGHYDVKLSDIERMEKADLIVSFRGMPSVDNAASKAEARLLVDAGGGNWMTPVSYISGLGLLADGLSKRFPEDKVEIMRRKEETIRNVKTEANSLMQKITRAAIPGKPVIASSMQKEPLEWMGLRVVGEYGRQEAMSARELVRLCEIGRHQHAIMVVDNLQSGPDTGKGIAETLRVPHIVLTNFPSEKGYLATLRQNVDAVLVAAVRK